MTEKLVISAEKESILKGVYGTKLPIVVSGRNEEIVQALVKHISKQCHIQLIDKEQYEYQKDRGLFSPLNETPFVVSKNLVSQTRLNDMGSYVKVEVISKLNSYDFYIKIKLIEKPSVIHVKINEENPSAIIDSDDGMKYQITVNGKKDYVKLTVDSDESYSLLLDAHKARLTETLIQGVDNYKSAGLRPLLVILDASFFSISMMKHTLKVITDRYEKTGISYLVKTNESNRKEIREFLRGY